MGLFSFLFGGSAKDSTEKKLGIKISQDYLDFIGSNKIKRVDSEMFLGIDSNDYLSVVKMTLDERRRNSSFPLNLYVISPLGIDGILILQDSNGNIYEYFPFNKPRKIYNNLQDYLKSIK